MRTNVLQCHAPFRPMMAVYVAPWYWAILVTLDWSIPVDKLYTFRLTFSDSKSNNMVCGVRIEAIVNSFQNVWLQSHGLVIQ